VAARSKTTVAVSHKVRRELRGYGVRSQVIENAVPLDRFQPMGREDAREELGIKTDGPLAIFVGRADHTKGFDLVREVKRLRPELSVLCVTPSEVGDDELMVRRNVPNERMPLYYSAADVLLFPSRYESFGYTPLEAMACGLPVVASRTGVFEDLDDPRVGRLVDALEPEALASAVDEVLAGDHDPRAVVSERFSLERFAQQYRQLARRVVEGPDGRAAENGHLDTTRS
jgi:glycosyltransferase involved in cell wall biosynthesis